ncbi:MAG: helix-turn-helix domain-containing protein [Sodaliphilus sp.]
MKETRELLHTNGYAIYHIDASAEASEAYELSNELRLNMLIFCEEGHAEIEFNTQHFSLTRRCRFFGTHMLQLRMSQLSHDFKAWVLLLDGSFSRDVSVGMPIETLSVLYAEPVKVVSDAQEWDLLLTLMRSMHMYHTMGDGNHTSEVAGCLFRSMLLVMVESQIKSGNFSKVPTYTMADTYFRDFAYLVADHVESEHEVSFYADRLNITTKYLSDICKQKIGKGAKEMISEVLISKLKRDVKMSGLSLKEISYKYAFADQSSMGKFFRKMTGVSPLEFKQACGMKID